MMMIGTPVNPADYEIGKIPDELSHYPFPLIYFTGLHVNLNQTHHYVWEAFANNRAPDRTPLQYRLMDADCMIPPSKQKKSSYDWYLPKGILKRNWLIKHLHEVPAVVVLCIELDWDDVNFLSKKQECVNQVEALRGQFINRSCKIALVLLQKSLTIPIEDALTTERASNICDACNIPPTSLFVLPYQDSQHFLGYIFRMEAAFFELANAYYQQEMKFIRSHREQLNKTNHGLLFVRHQFKLGFFSEIRQDFVGAIKNYKQAYSNLMEIRSSLTNIYEMMTIAGFINYKICRLLFGQNDPREAIAHFQKHINIFKSKEESPELQFEHFAWLSVQFSIFAEIFDSAITSGLVPGQIQNPGYYYYEAALLSIKRRAAIEPFREQTKSINEEFALTTIEEAMRIEFYGQRPWRPGCQSLNPLDPEKEREGIKVLQYHEVIYIDHSNLIINLLKSAMNQFKKNKCPRMMRFMIVLIAQNYHEVKDYDNCLTHLNQILPFYRIEKWKPILVSILTTALNAAYLSANLTEFVKLGFEFISSWIPGEESFKSSVQESIFNVLSLEPPCSIYPHLSSEENESITDSWRKTFTPSSTESTIIMKMNSIVPFIEIKPVFTQKVYLWQETVNLKVYLLLNSPRPITFERLTLTFNEPYYNQFCDHCPPQDSIVSGFTEGGDIDEEISSSLHFEPMVMKCLDFNLIARKEDYGKLLRISEISLFLGSQLIKMIFNWVYEDATSEVKCSLANSHNSCSSSSSSLLTSTDCYPIKFYHLAPTLNTFLKPRIPKVDLSLIHSSPALLNEMYPIQIVIDNQDDYSIKDVSLTIIKMEESSMAPPSTTIHQENVPSFIIDGSSLHLGVNQSLSTSPVDPKSFLRKVIYLPISDLNPQRFMFTVYFTSTNSSISSSTNYDETSNGFNQLKETVPIQVINPFNVSFSTCTPLNTPSRAIRLMEPFLLKVDISCLSPFPLELIDCNVELHQNIFHTLPYTPTNLNKLLRCDDKTDCHFALYSENQITQETGLGVLVIRWRKSSSPSTSQETDNNGYDQINTIRFNLPSVTVQNSFLYVETKLPKFGVTRESLLLTYNLANRTDNLLPISLSLEKSDNFMFAGNSAVKLSIPAKSQSTQLFVLYPLVCGHVALPKLKIIIFPESDNPIDMDEVLEDIVPSYLLVMPQRKIYAPFDSIGDTVMSK